MNAYAVHIHLLIPMFLLLCQNLFKQSNKMQSYIKLKINGFKCKYKAIDLWRKVWNGLKSNTVIKLNRINKECGKSTRISGFGVCLLQHTPGNYREIRAVNLAQT